MPVKTQKKKAKAPARTAKKATAAARKAKATTRKTTTKKIASKATKTTKKVSTTALQESMKASELMKTIAEQAGITTKETKAVFESLGNLMHRHLKKRAVGEFTLPGLAKFKVVRKPATKARKGTNPFTGEEMVFKAKPARNVVKVRPLKKLKEMAES
jgi:nucleoid DNA-binding protein